MTTRFADKDPADIVALRFDFSAHGDAVSSPAVTIAVVAGADPDAAAMLLGSPTASGAIVTQRVQAGLDGRDYAIECAADVGIQRITLATILAVRDRPIVATGSPVYCTEADFEARFGADELRDLLADGTSYIRAENDAASLIDGFLASRYPLPLAVVPDLVRGWAADITRYRLWDERAPEEVRRRYDDALAHIKLLAGGTITLPPDALGQSPGTSITFGGYSAERVFTAETLEHF